MIFRDNKSHDCGVNEVTAYKGREGSGSHRCRSFWNWRPTDIQFELSKVKSPWHKLRYRDPIFPGPVCPFRYSSRCNFSAPDNKLFDRELSNVIRPPISHAIRFIGNAPARIENKFGDDQIILLLQQSFPTLLPTLLYIFMRFILFLFYCCRLLSKKWNS